MSLCVRRLDIWCPRQLLLSHLATCLFCIYWRVLCHRTIGKNSLSLCLPKTLFQTFDSKTPHWFRALYLQTFTVAVLLWVWLLRLAAFEIPWLWDYPCRARTIMIPSFRLSYPCLLTFWYATPRRNSGTTFPPRTARVMGLQLLTRLRSFFNLTSFRDFTRPSRSFARLLSAVFICSPWAQFPAKYVPVDWWITHPNHRCGEMVKSLMLVYRSFLGL